MQITYLILTHLHGLLYLNSSHLDYQGSEASTAIVHVRSISPILDVGFGFPVPQAELHPS